MLDFPFKEGNWWWLGRGLPEHCQLRHWSGGLYGRSGAHCAYSFYAVCYLVLLRVGYGVLDEATGNCRMMAKNYAASKIPRKTCCLLTFCTPGFCLNVSCLYKNKWYHIFLYDVLMKNDFISSNNSEKESLDQGFVFVCFLKKV